MSRKILLLILAFFLVSCKAEEPEEPIPETKEYIDPVKDVFLFSLLEDDVKERIKKANCNTDYKNYQFGILGKDVYQGTLTDTWGNEVVLKDLDRFCMEIVSVNCDHCKRQLEVMPSLAEESDVPFVQYFNVGTREEVLDLYAEKGMEIPEWMIVISEDEDMKDYVKNELQARSYPTFLTFLDGRVSFDAIGEIDEETFACIRNIGFEDPLDMEEMTELKKMNRSMEDVKNDLSEENRKRLESLDHDGYTEELTFTLMGKKLDFGDLTKQKKSEVYVNQIDDFSVYEDKQLVLIYTFLRDNGETDKVERINELIKANEDVEYIVVLIEGAESSSSALKNMKIGFSCPVVSVLGYMPEDFFEFGLIAYPSAVFVDEGTFTGAYSDIESKEKPGEAIDMFLGEKSIALKSNN